MREMVRNVLIYVVGIYLGTFLFEIVFTINSAFILLATEWLKAVGIDPKTDILALFVELSDTLNLGHALLFLVVAVGVGVLNYQYALRSVTILYLIFYFPICAYRSVFPGAQKSLDIWFREFCAQVFQQGGHALAFAGLLVLLKYDASVWWLFAILFGMPTLSQFVRMAIGAPGGSMTMGNMAFGSMGRGTFQSLAMLSALSKNGKANLLGGRNPSLAGNVPSNVVPGSGQNAFDFGMNGFNFSRLSPAYNHQNGQKNLPGNPAASPISPVNNIGNSGIVTTGGVNQNMEGIVPASPSSAQFKQNQSVQTAIPNSMNPSSNVKQSSVIDNAKQMLTSPTVKKAALNTAKIGAKATLYTGAAMVGGAMGGNEGAAIMAAKRVKSYTGNMITSAGLHRIPGKAASFIRGNFGQSSTPVSKTPMKVAGGYTPLSGLNRNGGTLSTSTPLRTKKVKSQMLNQAARQQYQQRMMQIGNSAGISQQSATINSTNVVPSPTPMKMSGQLSQTKAATNAQPKQETRVQGTTQVGRKAVQFKTPTTTQSPSLTNNHTKQQKTTLNNQGTAPFVPNNGFKKIKFPPKK